ncbi:hypothetical protein EYZ11_002303 [Aspergillus tanneri]|uniref:Uncharacterized protein n=1 Tax=Aspergillus tanneri TaxID=1220188 RepID=A0A4S3JU44_9EURO|nr:uncharacterized protein ATNIH1004_001122 [Aspergillus tanneri]KAA8652218.1 hypothetical protein ATNIH1004_001122 [Aspergillus tanneri]THC98221.1 hypothetical protein EYZ11_002303 [Aspergillus tanneri]
MPFKIDCNTAKEMPVPPVFKLKRSCKEIKIVQKAMESNTISITDIDQALSDDETLHQSQVKVQTDAIDNLDGYGSDFSETTSVASDDSTEPEAKGDESQQPIHDVCHPWDVVDYHLYLCGLEKGMDTHTRRNGMYVYDGLDCRPVCYRELCDKESFDPSNIGDDPKFLSWILPISDGGPSFNGRSYVLGFDYNSGTLFARHFDWMPSRTDDIWCVWDDGCTTYRLSVPDLFNVLESVLSSMVHVGGGILSSSPYCLAATRSDDPGFEIVITILFCQWVIDFAEIFFDQDEAKRDIFTMQLTNYMEECRLILQRASYRAWFASRDGYTKNEYSRKAAIDKYTNDLYTFSKSAENGSLKGKSWRAPGLDTCNLLRQKDRVRRRERAERRLTDLFTISEPDSHAESSEKVLEKMLAKAEENFQSAIGLETPRTPSPRLLHTNSFAGDVSSPRSPEIIIAAKEPSFNFEATDYHKIPLPLLLERTLELFESQPGLDTPENRYQFGALLTGFGIAVQRKLMEHSSSVSKLGYENNSWKLVLRSLADSKRPIARHRLLPSPILD